MSSVVAVTTILGTGCKDSTPPPTTGAIRVTVTTTGSGVDPDGYTVTIGDRSPWALSVNDGVTFSDLPAGDHFVRLDAVAPNCQVNGTNPRRVTVVPSETVTAEFSVACLALPGDVRVTTATTGVDLDPDGYQVSVDGGPSQAIGTNGAVIINTLPAGEHTVALSDMASNCTVGGTNPRSVIVPFGSIVEVSFTVQCAASGSLEVTTASSGTDLDPNGYTVAVEGGSFRSNVSVPANGTATVSGMRSGDYQVTLGGVAGNCDVTGHNPRTVTVPARTMVPVAFGVTCAPVTRLAFVNERDGNAEIYTINSNGTNATRLTTDPASDVEPAWSPDGSKIAFRSDRGGNRDIYIMNADGSGLVRVTTAAASDYYPAWSPDGSRIAFVSERDGNAEIYVMNADGTNQVRLTNSPAVETDPAWSPDGSKIAFTSDGDGNAEVYVMNATGSGVTRLTNNQTVDGQPAWSPDGAKLAFSRGVCETYICAPRIVVVNADGSGITWLTFSGSGTDPAWSPDGRKIAFTSASCDYYYGCSPPSVMIVRTDATNPVEVTEGPASNPSWRR